MTTVELRPMTPAEYDGWLPGAIESYAADHVRVGSRPAEGAREAAREEFDTLLPDGAATSGHHLLVATDAGEPVGILWLNIQQDQSPARAFVYDVEVDESKRGRGYGRAIMLAAESLAHDHGANTIRLHVFGDNTVARRLYEGLGYQPTNIGMAKPLSAG